MADGLKPLVNGTSNDKDSLESSLHAFMRGKQLDTDSCLPAIVISYDRDNNIATVRPLIMKVLVDDTIKSRQLISKVPVLALGGGGFFINFPLEAGDLGWIHANDRDLSLFKQTLAESAPPGGTFHSFDNSMFVPDVFRNYTVQSADSNAMVISSTDGTTRIAIRPGEIDITAPTAVNVTTPLATFSSNVKINGNLVVAGTSTFTGLVTTNGGFTDSGATGTFVNLPADTKIGGVVVLSHGHIQNGTSGRTSAGMIS